MSEERESNYILDKNKLIEIENKYIKELEESCTDVAYDEFDTYTTDMLLDIIYDLGLVRFFDTYIDLRDNAAEIL